MTKTQAKRALAKAQIAADAAQRAVLALSPRTDVRLTELRKLGGPVNAAYDVALLELEQAHDAVRNAR